MVKHISGFKDYKKDSEWFFNWAERVQSLNSRKYFRKEVSSKLGKTIVWSYNEEKTSLPTLVIFPGFRTSPLFWDLDNALKDLAQKVRLFLIETNGQPNPSDGSNPSIKSNDYGVWAADVLDQLNIDRCYIAGASFGGTVCMKLAIVAPQKVIAAFLLNPGCLQPFSMALKNLYYNTLPIISPSKKNVVKFLEKAVFCLPNHDLKGERRDLIVDFQMFALTRYNDKTEKPYYMNVELTNVSSDVYLLLGDKDILFPTAKSAANAKSKLKNLKETFILPDIGHGIETDKRAMDIIERVIKLA
ncbi:MAG TPA: alpha/beta fold hydrolase [Cyclobacteriaceae bacterium]|nr:alpha/beta fold hydrolase [Cyclobacteriaceae bacterium]